MFELAPSFFVPEGTFSLLIAPDAMLLDAVERQLRRRERLRVLYVCGNYSRFLSRIDRQCPDFGIQRAFTVHQLLTILGEADQHLVIIEHDATLYDDAPDLAGQVSHACTDLAQAATVIVLARTLDPVLRRMSAQAARVVYVRPPDPGASRVMRHRHDSPQGAGTQTTLEGF
jgi:hypothetical protein